MLFKPTLEIIKPHLLEICLAIFALVISIFFIYWKSMYRLYKVITLFDEKVIVNNFKSADKLGFPFNSIQRGERIAEFNESKKNINPLPATFTYKGETFQVKDWLTSHWTTGLVVLKVRGTTEADLVYEEFFRGNTSTDKVISWSTGKSVVSALVGIAVKDGLIKSIDDKVVDYCPILKQSGYAACTVKHVLQMSSGVRFNEDYASFWSDVNRMGRAIALGVNFDGFICSLSSEREPGTHHHYISSDTQVLGMVLKAALKGRFNSLSSYLEEKIWKKCGFEDDAFWMLDNDTSRMELAFGTLNARTRDYARFGWLYINKGKSPLDGSRVVEEDWVKRSIEPDAPHLMPGINKEFPIGYGYQWWLPGKSDDVNTPAGDYLAIGIYNQFIYVNPRLGIVIVRNSAYPHYESEMDLCELQCVELLREIANHYS